MKRILLSILTLVCSGSQLCAEQGSDEIVSIPFTYGNTDKESRLFLQHKGDRYVPISLNVRTKSRDDGFIQLQVCNYRYSVERIDDLPLTKDGKLWKFTFKACSTALAHGDFRSQEPATTESISPWVGQWTFVVESYTLTLKGESPEGLATISKGSYSTDSSSTALKEWEARTTMSDFYRTLNGDKPEPSGNE